MKNLLNRSFLLLTLLFTLLAIALPTSAADNYDYFVAGTEFEPVDSKDKVFFLKDKSSNSSNLQLKFNEESLFTQDIVVCNNSNGKVSPVDFNLIKNDAFNRVSGVSNTSTNITMRDKDYVVTKPTNISKIDERISEGGQSKSSFGVMHDANKYSYVNNYMFISNPQSGGAHAHLQYSLYGITANVDYRLEVAYTNISNVTNLGKSSLWLHIYIHGYTGSGYEYIEQVKWQRNAGEDLVQLNDNTGLKMFTPKKDYEKIVITIISDANDTGPGAILGIDYIRVWAKQNPKPNQPEAPELIGNYSECKASGTRKFTDYFKLQDGSTTGLKFYNYNTNTAVTTFSASDEGDTKYNYTYTENGVESKKGTITVTVKGNETIIITPSPSNATITCSNQIVTLSGPVSTTQYEWTTPNGDTGLGNNFLATSAGTYKIKGTGSNSCPANGSIQVIESKVYPTISDLTSKNSKNEVSKDITCDEDVLTITPTVSSTNVTYSWTGPDNFNKNTKTINVDKPGTYTLVVKDKTTGCPSEPLSITIEDKTKKPVIDETHIKNVSGKDVLDGALTCTNEVLVLSADITCDNPISYLWTGPNNFSKTSAQVEVTAKGTYKLVVKDTKTGCQSDEREFYIQENKDKPVIEKIVATNSAGEETNIVTCTDGTLTITPTVFMRDVSYKWDNNKTTASITETAAGTYTLVVTNNTNGCSSEPKSITLTKDESVPTVTVKSFDSLEPNATEVNTLTCTYPELYIVADVNPTDVKYYWNGSGNSGESYLKVTEPATYTLKVVSNVNGCVLDGIEYEIKQDTIKPVVKLRPQYKLDGSEGSTEFTCERKNIILEADTEESKVEIISYKWSSSTDTFNWTATNEPGDYSVTVVAKNGCEATSSITLTENVVLPDITVTSLDSKGEPRTLLTCEEPEVTLNITLNNESELGNDGPVRYFWLFPETDGGVELQSIKMQSPTLCRAELVGPNGCITTKDIQLTEDKGKPVATLTQTAETITCSVPNVTISATTDIEADYEWYFDGKTYTDVTEINADKGGDGYLVVTSKTSGCSQVPYMFTVNQSTVVPEVPVIDDEKLALCPNTGIVNLTSFIQSPSADVQYTFYNEQGEKVDVTEVNTNVPNMTYTYEVTATATNGCVSDDAEFEVVVDGLIDFELETSSTRVMVGGEETKVTVVPSGVVADTYVWELNGEKVSADGTEYTTRLYVDTKYVVTGISRCETKTDDVSIEVVWPTAFTPYNGNGKNDDFAKGLPIIVFNRFYTKIFEGPDGWDGTINGSMNNSKDIAVPGVYYYAVTLPNGDIKKGTIEIIKVD